MRASLRRWLLTGIAMTVVGVGSATTTVDHGPIATTGGSTADVSSSVHVITLGDFDPNGSAGPPALRLFDGASDGAGDAGAADGRDVPRAAPTDRVFGAPPAGAEAAVQTPDVTPPASSAIPEAAAPPRTPQAAGSGIGPNLGVEQADAVRAPPAENAATASGSSTKSTGNNATGTNAAGTNSAGTKSTGTKSAGTNSTSTKSTRQDPSHHRPVDATPQARRSVASAAPRAGTAAQVSRLTVSTPRDLDAATGANVGTLAKVSALSAGLAGSDLGFTALPGAANPAAQLDGLDTMPSDSAALSGGAASTTKVSVGVATPVASTVGVTASPGGVAAVARVGGSSVNLTTTPIVNTVVGVAAGLGGVTGTLRH